MIWILESLYKDRPICFNGAYIGKWAQNFRYCDGRFMESVDVDGNEIVRYQNKCINCEFNTCKNAEKIYKHKWW
jgi:hypothetical protein